MLTSIIY